MRRACEQSASDQRDNSFLINDETIMEEMRLDGNAAAGSLGELFARDITSAMARCAKCGRESPVGGLLDYGHAMGVVLRCGGCEAAVLRLVQTSAGIHLDPSGLSLLVVSVAQGQ
jgi:hypothetical protein